MFVGVIVGVGVTLAVVDGVTEDVLVGVAVLEAVTDGVGVGVLPCVGSGVLL